MRLHVAVILSALALTAAPVHAARVSPQAKKAPAARRTAAQPKKVTKIAAPKTRAPRATKAAEPPVIKPVEIAKPAAATPTVATAPTAAKPGLVRRMLGAVAHSFTTSEAMKTTLRTAKAERKNGELIEAAGTLIEAPKPGTLMERIRLWRANRALVKASRNALKATSMDVLPQEGYGALKLMASEGKMSLIDRMRSGVALVKGGKNAFATARKLGDRGQVLEAAEMLKWASSHGKLSPMKEALFRIRLNNQIMQAADRVAARYKSLPEGPAKEAAFDETMKYLNAAQEVGSADTIDLNSMTGRLGKMLGGRIISTENVVRSMGISGEEIGAKLQARAEAEEQAGTQRGFDFDSPKTGK